MAYMANHYPNSSARCSSHQSSWSRTGVCTQPQCPKHTPKQSLTHLPYNLRQSTIYINIHQYTSIYIYVFKIISTILIPFDSFWGFDRNVVHLKLPETSSHRVCPLKPLGIPGHRVPFGYGSIPIDTMFSGMNIHKSQL